MKKRVLCFLLALMLTATSALAAADSTDNFVRQKTYSGNFSDLSSGSVFYENVVALYEYGLSVGKEDGTFGLQDTLTVSQIIIFAGRIRSLYRTGDAEAGADAYRAGTQAAYEPYLRYLQAEGVLGGELEGTYLTAATRAQMAHVLAGTLPADALPLINDSLVTQCYASRRFITDVTEYTDYYSDILLLYRAGVCVGSDETGSFLPDQPITRGAAAAMLTRMVDPALRLTPAWSLEDLWSAQGATLADLVEPGTYVAAPVTEAEMDSAIRYMLFQGTNTLTFQYGSATADSARAVMEQALTAVKTYVEQCYNAVTCTYSTDGTITLTFTAASAGDRLEEYRTAAINAAVEVHDAFWESGAITPNTSELEKARLYYTWICDHCTYDFSAGENSLSHTAYALFTSGTAVCDGYTGAYNMLLKLEGIDCTSYSNDEHIWTVATLDGTEYHIDTTWGDSGPQIDYAYFAMTPQQSWQCHPW